MPQSTQCSKYERAAFIDGGCDCTECMLATRYRTNVPRELAERQTCPACQELRVHTAKEWSTCHPLAGHGRTKEHGWSSAVLEEEARG